MPLLADSEYTIRISFLLFSCVSTLCMAVYISCQLDLFSSSFLVKVKGGSITNCPSSLLLGKDRSCSNVNDETPGEKVTGINTKH